MDVSLALSYKNCRVKISKNSGFTISMHFDSSSFTVTKDMIETNVVLRKDGIEIVIDSSRENGVNYRHPKGCQLPGFVENCFQHY